MTAINRRTAIYGLGASALAAATTGLAQAAPSRGFFARRNQPIGLQIYTLGDEAARDVDATFAQVAQIGYREIELPNLLGKQPRELAAAAAKAGLKIVSVHVPLVRNGGSAGFSLASDPARLADAMGTMGAQWVVAPLLLLPDGFRPQPGEAFPTAISRSIVATGDAIWKESASQLNRRAEALKPLGVKVAYHNHNLEFAPIGQTTGWDILQRETDPGLVSFEVDLGWVAAAGLDPVAFLKRAKGRVRLLHVKDVAAGSDRNYAIAMKPAEVGSGTLDWARILPEAYELGVRHFLVEQEPPFTMPRIEAAAKSFAFLSQFKG